MDFEKLVQLLATIPGTDAALVRPVIDHLIAERSRLKDALAVACRERDETFEALDEAYEEMHKQLPAITAVYNREVWDRVKAWGQEKRLCGCDGQYRCALCTREKPEHE